MRLIYAMAILATILSTACCGAAELGVNCMLVGKQVLEVSDTRLLTLRADGEVTEVLISPDGKYVVYQAEKQDATECRLAKISTGKTVTIMSRTDEERPASSELWSMDDPPGTAWSPDSSMLAFAATHLTWEAGKKTAQQYIVLFSASGAFRKALPLHSPSDGGDRCRISGKLVFTPDSRKILANLLIPDLTFDEKYHAMTPTVQLIDIATGTARSIGESKPAKRLSDTVVIWYQPAHIVGWSEDGALLCVTWGKGLGEFHKMALDGSSDQILLSNSRPDEVWSPDGSFAVLDDRGLSVRSLQAPTATMLVDSADVSLAAWAPNSRMILYDKKESMGDASKLRKRDFQSLWLSSIVPGKRNSMCIALDAERFPSSSRDCRKIAYISQGQLYIAELTLREPTVSEKLVTGIPLTEEETKMMVATNAKQIAVAMIMYSADNSDSLPPAGSVSGALSNYVNDKGIFLRPGTQDNIFKYVDPGVKTMTEIARPSETVLGELDAGYSWKVVLYADAHVELKAK